MRRKSTFEKFSSGGVGWGGLFDYQSRSVHLSMNVKMDLGPDLEPDKFFDFFH